MIDYFCTHIRVSDYAYICPTLIYDIALLALSLHMYVMIINRTELLESASTL